MGPLRVPWRLGHCRFAAEFCPSQADAVPEHHVDLEQVTTNRLACSMLSCDCHARVTLDHDPDEKFILSTTQDTYAIMQVRAAIISDELHK